MLYFAQCTKCSNFRTVVSRYELLRWAPNWANWFLISFSRQLVFVTNHTFSYHKVPYWMQTSKLNNIDSVKKYLYVLSSKDSFAGVNWDTAIWYLVFAHLCNYCQRKKLRWCGTTDKMLVCADSNCGKAEKQKLTVESWDTTERDLPIPHICHWQCRCQIFMLVSKSPELTLKMSMSHAFIIDMHA